MTHRFLMTGTGGWGRYWCEQVLKPLIGQGRLEPVAAADVSPDNRKNAEQFLGLPPERCFATAAEAYAAHGQEADFAIIVVPPAHHEMVVDLALEYGLDVLSEKPIADTMEASVRVLRKVQAAGKKMGVTMSHRFDQDKTTFREVLRSGRLGRLDYIMTRFTCACRKYGSWGAFRHEIPDTLMIEGSVHHLDILRSFANADCDLLYSTTWNPAWGEFQGDSCGLVTMHMANGTRGFYEGAKTNAKAMNCWGNEYFRAECEGGTMILDSRAITILREGEEPEPVPLLEQPTWRNPWLAEQFLDWREGGPPMETRVEDNIQASALVFASIESSRTGQPVKVQEFLQAHLS